MLTIYMYQEVQTSFHIYAVYFQMFVSACDYSHLCAFALAVESYRPVTMVMGMLMMGCLYA